MKKEKIFIDFPEQKSGKIEVEAKVCSNPFSKSRGLMFRSREKSPILIFKFKKDVREPIHSFFVFNDFVAVWMDSYGRTMEVKTVKPFLPYITPKKQFRTLVEIPINKKNKKILDEIEKFK